MRADFFSGDRNFLRADFFSGDRNFFAAMKIFSGGRNFSGDENFLGADFFWRRKFFARATESDIMAEKIFGEELNG